MAKSAGMGAGKNAIGASVGAVTLFSAGETVLAGCKQYQRKVQASDEKVTAKCRKNS